MLTEVKAYSSWRSAPTLMLDPLGRLENDLIQVTNIVGLDPVKGTVNTSPFGSVDGSSYTGSSVLSRNIVLTLKPRPDWDTWTFESLRRLLYQYFMPKLITRLVFYSDDIVPVEIYGVVEDVSVNMFSKEPELTVSIICPDPYFTALDPVVITGISNDPPITLDYQGSIESGIHVKVTKASISAANFVGIQIGNPAEIYLGVYAPPILSDTKFYEISTIPMRKFIQNVDIGTGLITNLLSKINVQEGSLWPKFEPGENEFFVYTDIGTHDWELTYYERFGGL